MAYNCKMCDKTFDRIYNYERHMQRKKACNREPSRSREKLSDAVTGNLSIVDVINRCIFCKNECKKKNLCSHYRNSCKLIPESKRQFFIDKYNNDKRHINTKKIINNTNNGTINNNINNINNNNSNSNNNINITNNNTVNLNTFGNEDTSYLTQEDKLAILNKGYTFIQPALEAIYYKNKNNRTMFQQNKNKPYIHCLESIDSINDYLKGLEDISENNKGNNEYIGDNEKTLNTIKENENTNSQKECKWGYKKLSDVNTEIFDKLHEEYEEWFIECGDKMTGYKKKNAKNVLNDFNNNNFMFKGRCSEEFKMFMYTFSDKIKLFYNLLKKKGVII